MNEKNSTNDTLSTLNSVIQQCNYTIEQSNNKNFRDLITTSRDTFEKLQWDLYTFAKQKGYYVPASASTPAEQEEIKNNIFK